MSNITERLDEILLAHRDAVNRGASINGLDQARTRLQALMLREQISELRPFTEKPFTDGIMAMREEIAAYAEGCIARLTEQLAALEGNTQEKPHSYGGGE